MLPKIESLANNQVIVITEQGEMFFSYGRLIGIKKDDDDDELYLTNLWDYSRTTLKYLKLAFNLDLTKSEIQQKLDRGEFKTYAD